jgi:thiol-disulfide isomerase/thioredoxin
MMTSPLIQKVKRVLVVVKPWAIYLGLFLVLRYTGIISSVSILTQKALMQTGAMDAKPGTETLEKKFDYDFSVQDLEGKSLKISDLKGKVLFINVWATWCGPCRVEMPSIQNLYNSVDHDKIVFVMLALDQKDPINKVSSFLKEKAYTFPVYLPAGELPEELKVRSIPTTFIVNREGKIVMKETGAANYDTESFKKFIESL